MRTAYPHGLAAHVINLLNLLICHLPQMLTHHFHGLLILLTKNQKISK